jgi:2-polyprenyl-3-methyl-5-hydroxy-6-metoxy-1,4-benzoquinol methylase
MNNWIAPPFYSIIWTSPDAQSYWEPKLKEVSEFWNRLEMLSVKYRLRDYAVQFTSAKGLIDFSKESRRLGLEFFPLEFDGVRHRLVIYRGDFESFSDAWTKGEIPEIGRLLGYPSCCQDWFNILWKIEKKIDTCLDQAGGVVNIPESPDCNILLRDVGVRAVFHLPHSFACPGTGFIHRELTNLAKELKEPAFDDWQQMLRWPIKYSALHSIAEITTPVFKIRRNTDYTASTQVVQYQGTVYPKYSASGLTFPFLKGSFKIPISFKKPDMWSENGFQDFQSMRAGHELILSKLSELVQSSTRTIVDLGCGNGELLRRISQRYPSLSFHGIDLSPEKIKRARVFDPEMSLSIGDVTRMEFDQIYDIAIVSLNRLAEAKRSGNEQFLPRLLKSARTILGYSYEHMLTEVLHGEVEG